MQEKQNIPHFKKIELERTPCNGVCPVYRLEILADGTVNYEGDYYVEKQGSFSWKLDPANIKKLQNAITKANYFDIQEKDSMYSMTCMAGCNTTITMDDGRKRTIENYHGDDKFPRSLKSLENAIDRISGVLSYVGKRIDLLA